jgi:hypothetical protein
VPRLKNESTYHRYALEALRRKRSERYLSKFVIISVSAGMTDLRRDARSPPSRGRLLPPPWLAERLCSQTIGEVSPAVPVSIYGTLEATVRASLVSRLYANDRTRRRCGGLSR